MGYVMQISNTHNGWNRISSGLDVEFAHGVPVRISNRMTNWPLDVYSVSKQIKQLTGLQVSVESEIATVQEDHEYTVCIDKTYFVEVLRRLALSSAAMFVDRFRKPIDRSAVDWDLAEFNYDFNHAIEHCCLSYTSIKKADYFETYIKIMHQESTRLFNEGISPLVEAE